MAAYNEAKARVFQKLTDLKVGTKLDIDKESNGRSDLYIQIVKEYIDGGNPNVEFNSDYTKVRKLPNFGF